MESVNPVNQVNQSNSLRLIFCPSLAIEHRRIDRAVPEGETVAGHLRAIGQQPDTLNARVFIDGEFIEQAQWEHAVPRANQTLTIRVIFTGGGGQGKDALRIVAMIGVVAAAAFTAGGGLGIATALLSQNIGVSIGGALAVQYGAAAAMTIAGSLAITARIPPARPRLRDQRQVLHG